MMHGIDDDKFIYYDEELDAYTNDAGRMEGEDDCDFFERTGQYDEF